MFWGVTILPGRRYSQTVEMSYHISKAVLEIDLKNPTSKRAQVMLEHNKSRYLLCNLDSEKILQTELDLIFTEGEEVTFFLEGDGTVHLTGYLLDFESDEEEDDEDEIESELQEIHDLKRKAGEDMKSKDGALSYKKIKTEIKDEDIDDDDDDDDDDIEDEIDDDYDDDLSGLYKDDDDDEIEEEEFGDEEDDDDDEDGGMATVKKPSAQKVNGQVKSQNENLNKSSTKPANQSQPPKKSNQQKGNQQQKPKMGGGQQSPNKFGKDFEQKFNQKQGGQSQKQKGPFTPTNKKEWKQANGGVKIKDIHEGNGPLVQKGKFVHLRYIGKLTNNKIFDRTGSKPFSFKLGAGQVVKGLEVGIEGMKTGGKRNIIIPPNMGYGKHSMGPIPPNSTLNFEVELVSVT